jgi:hypothetical protein
MSHDKCIFKFFCLSNASIIQFVHAISTLELRYLWAGNHWTVTQECVWNIWSSVTPSNDFSFLLEILRACLVFVFLLSFFYYKNVTFFFILFSSFQIFFLQETMKIINNCFWCFLCKTTNMENKVNVRWRFCQ